jgi:hypothetical protein
MTADRDNRSPCRARPRMFLLFALAALIGAAVAVLPALAAPAAVKLQVNQNCVQPNWPCWTAETSGSYPRPASRVTIAAGGQVEFVEHDASTPASVNWMGGATPVCTGVPTTATLNWEGSCKFEQPGTYRFESATMFEDSYENYKKYEVVVEGASSAPTTGTTSEGGSTPSTTTPSPPPVGESPTGSPFSDAPTIHSSQRGTTVKGSLQIAKVGAGDRLEVDLLASTASLAKAGHTTRVGRFVNNAVSAGRLSFAVKLNARARKALKRHHRLKLEVKITLTPAHGEAMSITKSVTVHV